MKYIYTLIIAICCQTIFAQSTTITPGNVLPKVTTAQRTAMTTSEGTLVFDSETKSYWYVKNNLWEELGTSTPVTPLWEFSGPNNYFIKNTNENGFWSGRDSPNDFFNIIDSGYDYSEVPSKEGQGTRLMWDTELGYFRSGYVFNTEWDRQNLGPYSFAAGVGTIAKGIASISLGLFSKATGNYSVAIGRSSEASGESSMVFGTQVNSNGFRGSTAFGDDAAVVFEGKSDATNRFSAWYTNGYKLFTARSNSFGIMALANANSWSSISDSTKKENFIPSVGEKVLESVSKMRIGTWNYKGQDAKQYRHWGVMAQDFYHHFGKDDIGVIGCDTMIATADFDGVSFAAIKALEERTRILQQENDELKNKMNIVLARIEELIDEKLIDSTKQIPSFSKK